MSLYPESQLGIWLNTPIKYLETTAEQNLRAAQNDPLWCAAANDSDVSVVHTIADTVLAVDADSTLYAPSVPASQRSDSELEQLFELPADSLFDFVKFSMVSHVVGKLFKRYPYNTQPDTLRVVDLGCGLQPAHRYLRRKIRNLSYIGADHQAQQLTDAVIDVSHPRTINKIRNLGPDVLLLLDILPKLHTSVDELQSTLARLAIAASETSLILFSLPRGKKTSPNSNTADNGPLLLSNEQWLELIGEHFLIEEVMRIGFLPANLSASDPIAQADSVRHRGDVIPRAMRCAIRYLGEWNLIRMIDLFITRLLGRSRMFQPGSHSLLVSAKPKRDRPIR